MSDPKITLVLIVLLPMIPAYFLFRNLPSTGDVKGTIFKGMEIKLGGAFGGYFVVMFFIFHYMDKWSPPPPPPLPPTAEVWHLSGQLADSSGHSLDPIDIKDFSFAPRTFDATAGGNFNLTFVTQPAQGGGTTYPELTISHKKFLPMKIVLDPSSWTEDLSRALGLSKDDARHELRMQHITLRELPPYRTKGRVPSQLSGPVARRPPTSTKESNP
jgi:hypothetical protein